MPTVQLDGPSCTMYMLYYSRDMGYNVITMAEIVCCTLYNSRDMGWDVNVRMIDNSTCRQYKYMGRAVQCMCCTILGIWVTTYNVITMAESGSTSRWAELYIVHCTVLRTFVTT